MVAVIAEKVVACAQKYARSVVDDVGDFLLGQDGETVDDLAAKSATRRFEFGSCPVDSADAFAIVAAVSVFAVVDHHTRVEEGATNCPEYRGKTTGLRNVSQLQPY